MSVDIEASIANSKEMARERQPIRYDIYLQHIAYLEGQITQLRSIVTATSSEKSKNENIIGRLMTKL